METYNSISALKTQFASGKLSCVSLVNHYLKKITDSKTNAFVEVYAESALKKAKEVDGKIKKGEVNKLAGLIVGVKDNISVKGKSLTASSKILENFHSIYSATAIEKLINRKIDVTKTNITLEDIPSNKEKKAASKPPRKNDNKGDKKGSEKGERKGLAGSFKNKKEKKQASNALRSTNKPVQEETKTKNVPVGFGENIPAFLKDTPE